MGFKDAMNREWIVELSTAVLRRLAQPPLSFSLNDIMPVKVNLDDSSADIAKYQAFIDDDLRFADVLYNIIKPQADKCGITQEQFEEGLKGGANQRAILAFHNAFMDFSQAPRKTILRGIRMDMEKTAEFSAIADKKIDSEAAKMDAAKMEAMFDDLIQQEKNVTNGVAKSGNPAEPSLKPVTATAAT